MRSLVVDLSSQRLAWTLGVSYIEVRGWYEVRWREKNQLPEHRERIAPFTIPTRLSKYKGVTRLVDR